CAADRRPAAGLRRKQGLQSRCRRWPLTLLTSMRRTSTGVSGPGKIIPGRGMAVRSAMPEHYPFRGPDAAGPLGRRHHPGQRGRMSMATMSLKDHLRPIRGLLLALLFGTATIAPAPADPVAELTPLPRPAPPAPDPAETAIFAMPRIIEESRAVLARLRGGGDLADAIRRIDDLLDDHPESGLLHANRAALATIAGEEQLALDLLERAASLGLPDPAAIAGDPVFAPLAADPAHARRLAAVADAPPLPADPP